MTNLIGKLQRVHLREVWRHEAYDFTQWLQVNIDILNEALDLELVSAEREQAAGSFSIDLVAESSDGETYVIENQLEKSNHDHLGKVITYLTAMKARGAIWIVSEPRQEHVNAMAWLNEASSADFYLVKVEAVRIGDSSAAPMFTLIVGPSAEIKEAGRINQGHAERQGLYREWWTLLLSNPDASLHSHKAAPKASWFSAPAGVAGLDFNYTLAKKECGAELYIDRIKGGAAVNEMIFDQLFSVKDAVESAIAFPISWQRLEGKRACRIRIDLPGGYRAPEEEWSVIQDKQIQAMNQLESALRPILISLNIGR
jgi:hypothetical protein